MRSDLITVGRRVTLEAMPEWARTPLVGAGMVQEGLVTVEKATVIFYRGGEPPVEP